MKSFTIIGLGLIFGLTVTSGCGMMSLLQCGEDVPCDLNANGSTTTVLGQSADTTTDTGDNPINTIADPQYSPERIGLDDSASAVDTNPTSADSSTADAQEANAVLTEAELTALIANDSLLMSVFGLEDIPFLLSNYFDNLLLDSLAPTGGSLSNMTFLQRLCIDEGFPEYQCRQRYGR